MSNGFMPSKLLTTCLFARIAAARAPPVISAWDVTTPPLARTSDRDVIQTNVLAVHFGNITAKDARLFAQV